MAWTTSYYHHDAQGSTRLLTDSNQQVTDRYEYDAFGNQRSVTGTTVNPFRFVGQLGYYYDADSGNYYVRQREYRPTIIVWLSADPLRFEASDENWYRYGLNSPTNTTDPSGEISTHEYDMGVFGSCKKTGGPAKFDLRFRCYCVLKITQNDVISAGRSATLYCCLEPSTCFGKSDLLMNVCMGLAFPANMAPKLCVCYPYLG
jgi:RHS repeat-associated protein